MEDIFKVVFHVAGHAIVHGANAVAKGAAHGGADVVRGVARGGVAVAHVAATSGRGAEHVARGIGKGAASTAKTVARSHAVKSVAKGASKGAVEVGKGVQYGAKTTYKGVKVAGHVAQKGAVEVGKGAQFGAKTTYKGVKAAGHVAQKGAVEVGKGAEFGAKTTYKGVKVAGHVAQKGAVEVGKGVQTGAHVANQGAVAVGKGVIDGAKVVGNVAEKPLEETGKVAKKVAVATVDASIRTAEVTTRAALITADALTQPTPYVYYGHNYPYTTYRYRRNRPTPLDTIVHTTPTRKNTKQQRLPARIPLTYKPVNSSSVFVIHSGFMQKRGERNTSFKKRFFVLTSEKKIYYKPGDTKFFPPDEFRKCKGVIDLATIVAMHVSPKNPTDFELVPAFRDSAGKKLQKRRYYKLRCDTASQRNSWLMAIEDTAQADLAWLARMEYRPEGEKATAGSAAPPANFIQPVASFAPSAPLMASAPPVGTSGVGEGSEYRTAPASAPPLLEPGAPLVEAQLSSTPV